MRGLGKVTGADIVEDIVVACGLALIFTALIILFGGVN